jgi:hypothetical protein
MPRGVSRVRGLLEKARQAALEAVAAYNNPLASFKSGTYVVLMHVAWTALFLAMFHRRGIKPYYRRQNSIRFERIEDRPKTWELRECVRQYWGGADDSVGQNLRFFIGLRNLIEHTEAPGVDLEIFGECQALLFNFEELLEKEFGPRYAMSESLAISLQFSRMREPAAQQALRQLLRPVPKDIMAYIDGFRSGLSAQVLGDMAYSYKVFLVPMLGANRSKDALAVEFVHYDPNNPEHEKAVALIKQRLVPALNVGVFKPSQVVRRVAQAIAPRRFTMNLHTLAWKYWKVRPEKEATEPAACNTKYCVYDVLHKDYVYTEDWVQHLVRELQDQNTYNDVASSRPPRAPKEEIAA